MDGLKFYRHIILTMSNDQRITVWHLALVHAIVYIAEEPVYNKKISISRKTVMALSHINSFMTYHKCIKELQKFGYLAYCPSYHPKNGSIVQILIFA